VNKEVDETQDKNINNRKGYSHTWIIPTVKAGVRPLLAMRKGSTLPQALRFFA